MSTLEMLKTEDKETNMEDFTKKMFGKLTYLKSLELEFLINIHKMIPLLETLNMEQNHSLRFPMDANYLVEVLDSIGNIKNLCIKDWGVPFYILNNKDFDRILDEDEIKSVFQTAMDIINKKFSIELNRFEIVDKEYGWTIKKEEGKPATMTQVQAWIYLL